jgi:spore coat protein U-like protein
MKPRDTTGSAKVCAVLGCALLAALAAPIAHALVSSCTVSASSVAFGNYTADSPGVLDSTGTIMVTCTVVNANNPVTVALNTGASGTFTMRTMLSGVDILNYNLYLDAGHSQIWGDGSGGSLLYSHNVTNGKPDFNVTVFGEIPALQDVAAGDYTDIITVSVSY